jgi:hypothetical protein
MVLPENVRWFVYEANTADSLDKWNDSSVVLMNSVIRGSEWTLHDPEHRATDHPMPLAFPIRETDKVPEADKED